VPVDWPIFNVADPVVVASTSSEALAAIDALPSLAREHGRLVGYFSYDLGRLFEHLPDKPTDDLNLPLLAFARAGAAPISDANVSVPRAGAPRSNFSRNQYLAAVQRCIDYIAAGDIFQVNLAQRLTVPFSSSPRLLFDRLQSRHPATFPAFLDFGSFQLVSNSPELFFRIERIDDSRRRIVNRPIKGTRPRLPGMREELEASAKDRAELAMIVDLQRNDLGRICQTGSVKVTEPRVIETHPTVYHGVATVEGVLGNHVTLADVLRAVFPCGSITGCPKIRAMQIIDELEPHARGPYCGAIGFIDPDGAMEFSVAIRTIVVRDGLAYLGVGGGVVADSTPEAEYDETLVKARAMLDALGATLPDLHPAT
jgi:anthranilate/para-aminobenzoate synthase component I